MDRSGGVCIFPRFSAARLTWALVELAVRERCVPPSGCTRRDFLLQIIVHLHIVAVGLGVADAGDDAAYV